MHTTKRKLLQAFEEFLLLSLLALLVPAILIIDVRLLGHGISEASLTEWAQEILIFLCLIRFAFLSWRRPEERGFHILLTGLFGCILIRELDALLDQLTFHGFWVFPVSMTALGVITYAFMARKTTWPVLCSFIGSKPYFFMLFGAVILTVFSRSFGSGLLWDYIIGSDYRRLFKAAFQEGLELLGYIFIFYGTCLIPRSARTKTPD